jgi:hypothetical protein
MVMAHAMFAFLDVKLPLMVALACRDFAIFDLEEDFLGMNELMVGVGALSECACISRVR